MYGSLGGKLIPRYGGARRRCVKRARFNDEVKGLATQYNHDLNNYYASLDPPISGKRRTNEKLKDVKAGSMTDPYGVHACLRQRLLALKRKGQVRQCKLAPSVRRNKKLVCPRPRRRRTCGARR